MSTSFSSSRDLSFNKEENVKVNDFQLNEEIIKLQCKIEGYKTVAGKLPKYFGIIQELQLKRAHQEKLIQQLKTEGTKKDQLIHKLQQESLQAKSPETLELLSGSSSDQDFLVVVIGSDNSAVPTGNEFHGREIAEITQLKHFSSAAVTPTQPQKPGDISLSVSKYQQVIQSNPNPHLSEREFSAFEKNQENTLSSVLREKHKKMSEILKHSDEGAGPYIPKDLNVSSTLTSRLIYPVSNAAQDSIQMLSKPYGEGARPKKWNPLSTLVENVSLETNNESQINREEVLVTFSGMDHTASKAPDLQKGLSYKLNVEGRDRDITPVAQSLADLTFNGDLMKFPSSTTKDTENSETNIIRQSALEPSREEAQLASRAENMASLLKTRESATAISDLLVKFAEDVKNMEGKLHEYQTENERQQKQIQSLSKEGSNLEVQRLKDEISSLREENETLLDFIIAKKQSPLTDTNWTSNAKNEVIMRESAQAHYPNSPLMKKLESLEKINARLFRANKDWHNKWEILRSQAQGEKELLEANVTSLKAEIERLKEDAARQEKQLQEAKITKQESLERSMSLEAERNQCQTHIQHLNSQVSKLTEDKERLESEVGLLKNAEKLRSKEKSGNKSLETEIGLLKQQLTIFAEDFEKEKKDRTLAESKAQKIKKEKDQLKLSMDAKLNKLNVQLRMQEDDLRMKARQTAELQYQVDNLKLELQSERRKSSLAAQHGDSYQAPRSTACQRPGAPSVFHNEEMICPSMTPSYNQQSTIHTVSHHGSPEHLPGAWKCQSCTYINFPNRTVCDICGRKNTNQHGPAIQESGSGQHELQSRGDKDKRGLQSPDVVIDSL